MANFQLDEYDIEYTKNIEGVKTLYIPGSDFIGTQGTKNKRAIQYLFLKHYFPKIVKPKELLDDINSTKVQSLNSLITRLKRSPRFDMVYGYKPSGIGPGEVLLYFLVTGSTLSGFKTGDLKDKSNRSYEVKVGDPIGTEAIEDIRLANAKGLRETYNDLIKLQKKLGVVNTKESIEKSIVQQLRDKGGNEFTLIENEFKDRVVEYFSNKQAVLMYGDKKKPNFATIAAIKTIRAQDVSLHRFTNGEFKAQINIK